MLVDLTAPLAGCLAALFDEVLEVLEAVIELEIHDSSRVSGLGRDAEARTQAGRSLVWLSRRDSGT